MRWWPPRAWLPKSPLQWTLAGVGALVIVLLALLFVVPGLLGRGSQAFNFPRLGGSPSPSATPSPTQTPSASPSASATLPAGGQPGQSGVPPPRTAAQMAYDSDRQTVVLFGGLGGQDPSDTLSDTWTWDGVRWTQRHPATSPPRMQQGNMAFDAPRHRVVLFKGGQTWTWDGTNWRQEHPGRSPNVDCCPGMAYDAALLEVVLFGAGPSLDETWTWDGATWTQLRPPVHPSGRQHAAMTYDAARDKVVLYGGVDPFRIDTVLGDTWTFDGVTWIRSTPPSSPSPRTAASLTYDGALEAGILFGGRSDGTRFNATWRWDGTNWSRLNPPASPSALDFRAAAYDAVRQQVVLFGGSGSDQVGDVNETWVFDGRTWSRRT